MAWIEGTSATRNLHTVDPQEPWHHDRPTAPLPDSPGRVDSTRTDAGAQAVRQAFGGPTSETEGFESDFMAFGGTAPHVVHATPVASEPAAEDPTTHTVEDDEIARVEFEDATIEMHSSWTDTSLAGAMDGSTLDLNRVTPEMLKDLSPTNLNVFMDSYLGSREFDVVMYNGAGDRITGSGALWWADDSSSYNGATAMAGKMWASGDSEAFAQAFAAAPEHVLEYLTDNGSRVLTAENMALIMGEMQASAQTANGPSEYDPGELDAMGTLVQRYLELNAGDDPERVAQAVEDLMGEVSETLEFTPENAGVLTGTLVAGMLKHFDQIEASDEQRNRMITGVAGVLGAAAGAFGPWGAAVSVGISGLSAIYNEVDQPRDFEEVASRLQGAVQLGWLQNPPEGWSEDDVQTAVIWVETTILNNGQR